jgi:hypothetical protein
MSSATHFPDADDFQRQSDEFTSWLSQQPGVRINPHIQVADLRSQGAGRGVGTLCFSYEDFHPDACDFCLCPRWWPHEKLTNQFGYDQSLAQTSMMAKSYLPFLAMSFSPHGIPT